MTILDDQHGLNRRSFVLTLSAAAGALALESPLSAALVNPVPPQPTHLLESVMPARPEQEPLQWKSLAQSFDDFIMDSRNGVLRQRKDGSRFFTSSLEQTEDGGLTTLAPILMGKILRHDDVSALLPMLAAYFNEEFGIFLDGIGTNEAGYVLCEYWYLMNINALAGAIVRTTLLEDAVSKQRLRRSFECFVNLTRQVHYDFDDQGFNFSKHASWTNQKIYRQPDAIGGYGYLMLFAYELYGEESFRNEALTALHRYQSFPSNPWYEIPSGAMAALAAARLSVTEPSIDIQRILGFVLDSSAGLMRAGRWGGKEVNGLMAGFVSEPPDQAYSMETMVVLPYLLPILRYRPEFANDIGRYALNILANLRWFYSAFLPPEQQSRPDLNPAIPYERLSKSEKGHSPYAMGDFAGHRSVYGGAYALWLGELAKPTSDPFLLQLDVSRTDFLCGKSHPTVLYYNPWDEVKSVVMDTGVRKVDLYDLTTHRFADRGVLGKVKISLPPRSSRVLVAVPAGGKRSTQQGVLSVDGIPVDYKV